MTDFFFGKKCWWWDRLHRGVSNELVFCNLDQRAIMVNRCFLCMILKSLMASLIFTLEKVGASITSTDSISIYLHNLLQKEQKITLESVNFFT